MPSKAEIRQLLIDNGVPEEELNRADLEQAASDPDTLARMAAPPAVAPRVRSAVSTQEPTAGKGDGGLLDAYSRLGQPILDQDLNGVLPARMGPVGRGVVRGGLNAGRSLLHFGLSAPEAAAQGVEGLTSAPLKTAIDALGGPAYQFGTDLGKLGPAETLARDPLSPLKALLPAFLPRMALRAPEHLASWADTAVADRAAAQPKPAAAPEPLENRPTPGEAGSLTEALRKAALPRRIANIERLSPEGASPRRIPQRSDLASRLPYDGGVDRLRAMAEVRGDSPVDTSAGLNSLGRRMDDIAEQARTVNQAAQEEWLVGWNEAETGRRLSLGALADREPVEKAVGQTIDPTAGYLEADAARRALQLSERPTTAVQRRLGMEDPLATQARLAPHFDTVAQLRALKDAGQLPGQDLVPRGGVELEQPPETPSYPRGPFSGGNPEDPQLSLEPATQPPPARQTIAQRFKLPQPVEPQARPPIDAEAMATDDTEALLKRRELVGKEGPAPLPRPKGKQPPFRQPPAQIGEAAQRGAKLAQGGKVPQKGEPPEVWEGYRRAKLEAARSRRRQ